MPETLNDLVQIALVQQIKFVLQAQNTYSHSRRSKDARNISELMSGLSIISEAIGTMNDVEITSIDMESFKVLFHKLELENNYQDDTEIKTE